MPSNPHFQYTIILFSINFWVMLYLSISMYMYIYIIIYVYYIIHPTIHVSVNVNSLFCSTYHLVMTNSLPWKDPPIFNR